MYKILFEESDEAISLYDDIILQYHLLLKKEVSPKELEEIETANERLSCFYVALKYISFKNRSKEEIRKYLKKKKYDTMAIQEAIDRLEKQHFINDQEYLKMYIHDQFLLTKNGPKKIEYKLKQLGFQEEEIRKELDLIAKEEWLKRLEDSILKKLKTYKKEGAVKIKEKILYTFINEGYLKEDILTILNAITLPKNTDALKKEANKLYQKFQSKYQDYDLWYYLKGKLLSKGFTTEEVNQVLEEIKKSSER